MWAELPIQRYGDPPGPDLECIRPNHVYPRFDDVKVSPWKKVDKQTQARALEIWSHAFSTVRTPLAPDDLFVWIPDGSTALAGTLVAKPGVWANDDKSTRMHYVTLNYVVPSKRGQNLAKHMILSMAHELSKEDNFGACVKFMFELHDVPRSLYSAEPFLRFSYVWIPFFATETWEKVGDAAAAGFRRPGFTPDAWVGFELYACGQNRILFDPHDSVAWYDSFDSLLTFDKRSGAHVRWFWPLGNVRAYVENMHFSAPSSSEKVLIP
jgi:hypothetical protein